MQINSQLLAEILSALTTMSAQASGSEKRRATRVTVESRVKISTISEGHAMPGTALTRDLSQIGVGVITARNLAAGDRMLVELPRPNGKPTVSIVCDVRHVRSPAEGLFVIGAEFAEMAKPSEPFGGAGPTSREEEERIRKRILGS